MKPLIECVPNFSEGKDSFTLELIAEAIRSVDDVKLLHQDRGEAANRTVFTFAGKPEDVIEAAYKAAKVAVERIDMRLQKGEHPRIGALDVCPFVPISGISIEELKPMVDGFAQRLHRELGIPVFLYEESASDPKRKNLANHRIGDYEALEDRMKHGKWNADYGSSFNAKTGGTVCGVRNFLLAYNVNLTTKEVGIARKIAYALRESGWPKKLKESNSEQKSLALKKVKAIGWYIQDFDKTQVSINLTDFKTTPLWKVFENCKELAIEFGTEVSGSELIGLIPLDAVLDCGRHYHIEPSSATKEELVALFIEKLGFDDIRPFDPENRILEYLLSE